MFNIAGDIEDFPGLDSIPSYEVKILNDGGVQVRAKKSDLDQNKRVKGMCKQTNKTKNYVVVGGGKLKSSSATGFNPLLQVPRPRLELDDTSIISVFELVTLPKGRLAFGFNLPNQH